MSLKFIGAGFGRTGAHSRMRAPVPATLFFKVDTAKNFHIHNRKATGGH